MTRGVICNQTNPQHNNSHKHALQQTWDKKGNISLDRLCWYPLAISLFKTTEDLVTLVLPTVHKKTICSLPITPNTWQLFFPPTPVPAENHILSSLFALDATRTCYKTWLPANAQEPFDLHMTPVLCFSFWTTRDIAAPHGNIPCNKTQNQPAKNSQYHWVDHEEQQKRGLEKRIGGRTLHDQISRKTRQKNKNKQTKRAQSGPKR